MWKEYWLHRTPKLFEQVIYLEKIALFCGNVERVPTSPYTKIIWTGHLLRKNSTLLWECGKCTDFTAHQNYLNRYIFLEKISLFCGNVERYRFYRTLKLFKQVHLSRKNSTILWECGKSTDFTVHQNYLNRYIYLEKIALFCGNVKRVPILPYTKIIWTGTFI